MNSKDKILLKMYYKARKESFEELLKEFRKDKIMVKKIREQQAKEPTI